jgi:2-polyprenyl-3-methyl-5-hydroxy-6-metoxy-1,4-benzoquinol methylase
MTIEDYVAEAKEFFNTHHEGMTVNNHSEHDPNPDYWDVLLGDVKSDPEKWKGKNALDFGCGCGRNMKNLCSLAEWGNVHGCDISKLNAEYAKKYAKRKKHANGAKINSWENDGSSIRSVSKRLPRIKYDFAMTTVVLEHIPSYTIRKMIFQSVYDNLEDGGLFSFSVSNLGTAVDYHVDHYKFPMNSRCDNPEGLRKDLEEIGYKDVDIYSDSQFEGRKWSFVKGYK